MAVTCDAIEQLAAMIGTGRTARDNQLDLRKQADIQLHRLSFAISNGIGDADSIEQHANFDKEKQECLDFKNSGRSWREMEENKELKFKTDTIKQYAKDTGQQWTQSKAGRPASH